MTRDEVIHQLKTWIEDDPAETNAAFIELDDKVYSLQNILVEVEASTIIGQAFMRCYEDVIAGAV
jgi:hypothetical protein